MNNRTFFLTGLAVALLIAGVGSYYASGHADGLEHVASQLGFLDRADRSPSADGPFAGYSTKGMGDARVGGGLAGVVGCALVLLIGFGLFRTLRRRDDSREPGESEG